MSTVYRVRLLIDDEEMAVELHRSALAAAREAAGWARRFPEGRVVLEGLDVGADDGEADPC